MRSVSDRRSARLERAPPLECAPRLTDANDRRPVVQKRARLCVHPDSKLNKVFGDGGTRLVTVLVSDCLQQETCFIAGGLELTCLSSPMKPWQVSGCKGGSLLCTCNVQIGSRFRSVRVRMQFVS